MEPPLPPPPDSSSSSSLSSSDRDDDVDTIVVIPDIAVEETIGISQQTDLDLPLPGNLPADDIIHLSAEFIDDNPEILVNTLVEATDHAYISLSTPQALLLLPSNQGLGQPFDKFAVRCSVVRPTGTKLHRMRKRQIITTKTLSLCLFTNLMDVARTTPLVKYQCTNEFMCFLINTTSPLVWQFIDQYNKFHTV